MNHPDPKQYFASAHRAVAYGGAIEWEELPSLAERLGARRPVQRFDDSEPARFERSSTYHSAWDNTMPAPFDATPQPQPFRETLSGLAMREVTEPDVFRHFFGAGARA